MNFKILVSKICIAFRVLGPWYLCKRLCFGSMIPTRSDSRFDTRERKVMLSEGGAQLRGIPQFTKVSVFGFTRMESDVRNE